MSGDCLFPVRLLFINLRMSCWLHIPDSLESFELLPYRFPACARVAAHGSMH